MLEMRVVPKSCTPALKWFDNCGFLCASFEIEVMMYEPKSKKLNEFFCSPVVKGCEVVDSSIDAMCMKKVINLYKLSPHTEGLNGAD